MALIAGNHADVTIPNALVTAVNSDGTWACFELAPDANGQKPNIWLPLDERVTVKPVTPANWPPVEGDIWTAAGNVAWVVSNGSGTLYFVTAANLRAVYLGDRSLPMTTDQALVLFGNALTLLYRKT